MLTPHPRVSVSRLFVIAALSVLAISPAFSSERPPDSDISYWVRDGLRNDPRVDAATVNVATQSGSVTLSGSVRSLASKNAAVEIAKTIAGVVGVLDKLTLEPDWRSDTDLVQDVRHRIINNPSIESQQIQVTASSGTVTLRGDVATWIELKEAGLVASEVMGVREVRNELVVQYKTSRSDPEIKNDAVTSIGLDAYLRSVPITIEVNQGTVTLSGTVGSLFERDRASQVVQRVSHVKGVSNQLTVDWMMRHGQAAGSPDLGDDTLQENVRMQLVRDVRIDASKLEVRAASGHVTLSGSVTDGRQRQIAAQDARDTVGVAWITNNLMVVAPPRADGAIRDDVEFNIATDYLLSGVNVTVAVNNGTVTLGGTVPTHYEKDHARSLAWRTRGVRNVVNLIEVSADHRHPDPILEKEIRNALRWNWTTWWIHDDIQVEVDDGMAYLRGHVNTWSERTEAGSVAMRTPGVWRVHNYLRVGNTTYPWDDWDNDYYEDYYYPHGY